MLLDKWRDRRAPKKTLFASTEDNEKVSTLERLRGVGQQRTDMKAESTRKAKTFAFQRQNAGDKRRADSPTINP